MELEQEPVDPWFCPRCQGDGSCYICEGEGTIYDDRYDSLFVCRECSGSGVCPNCTAHYEEEEKKRRSDHLV